MNSKKIELVCFTRIESGRAASKNARSTQTGLIPAVLYGEKKPNVLLSTPQKEANLLHTKHQLSGHLVTLLVEGKKETALVKSLQKHHLKNHIIHIDFQRVNKNHLLHTSIPIQFQNADQALVTKKNGQITYTTTEVEIECLPKDLPEHITLDLSTLEIDQVIHRSDLVLPTGVTLTNLTDTTHNPVIVTAHLNPVDHKEQNQTRSPAENNTI